MFQCELVSDGKDVDTDRGEVGESGFETVETFEVLEELRPVERKRLIEEVGMEGRGDGLDLALLGGYHYKLTYIYPSLATVSLLSHPFKLPLTRRIYSGLSVICSTGARFTFSP